MTEYAKVPLTTPGEILLEEFIKPHEMNATQLAAAIHVPTNRITSIVNGTREITADTALRLGKFFGIEAAFWMNLQADYNLRTARLDADRMDDIEHIEQVA